MSQENVHDNDFQGVINDNNEETPDGGDSTGVGNPTQVQQSNSSDQRQNMQTTEVQRRRTEALERILMGSDSNLSLPHPTARRLRFENARRLRGQQRHFLGRSALPRLMERAVFIPLRTRNSMSAISLPTSQNSTTTSNNLAVNNFNDGVVRREGIGRIGGNRPRINVSSFFMELTYSTAEPNAIHLLKTSAEGHKRRVEIHAANTMNIVKQYCPAKPQKMNQYRCCARTKRDEVYKFLNVADKPLDTLDPMQIKCNTKVIVIITDDCTGKWNNPFTSYFMGSLARKHMNPTLITFQSEAFLNTLVEQLHDLHVFPKNTNANDPTFVSQAKRFLVMSTLAKLLEKWSAPLIILDSCLSKLTVLDEVVDFCKRFKIQLIEVDSTITSGNGKQKKTGAKCIRHQIQKALIESNRSRIGGDLKRLQQKRKLSTGLQHIKNNKSFNIDPTLISEDCRKIVLNLHERMTISLEQEKVPSSDRNGSGQSALNTQISLLEDGILADIENSDAFKCSRNLHTPNSRLVARSCAESARNTRERGENRPKTSHSVSGDDPYRPVTQAHFSTALVREQEKISELLFNELNQRWRLHGPQRFLPKTADAGPYCSGISDTEKQLLLSILQEVTYFETLKDIRNELKDSKKDLEGRLYGYNPDFSNLIASAEEFLHGKAACMEPCKDEMQFYKMPVSLVFSEAEVKYLKSKPPTYVVGQESPNQLIRVAIEESTRNKTKVIIVIEDNNEVLELLTMALWFFEKTPLATFQSKYYYNTSEFLLSLDACRFYFRAYPAHAAKKDEEHLFERWLGVGMNGILRSHQNKILLIDFPRPGTNLQNSKNILINRLKIEEKLNNIKSFVVGKPARKEDNLSTVENLLDEMQKALEPQSNQINFSRDKLLFRKSRRMYMDLKLYKQIEQKSRQDLKALRDWGLPEPENEHELWEKLRNSELIVNRPLPSREQDIGDELFETLESESTNLELSLCCYDDTSEPESILVDKSETSKKSNSEDANFLSEFEESMESVIVGDDHAPVADDIQHYFNALQFHANRTGSLERTSAVALVEPQEGYKATTSQPNFELFEANEPTNETTADCTSVQNSQRVSDNLHSKKATTHLVDGMNSTDNTNISQNQKLRRSAGLLNLLDKRAFSDQNRIQKSGKNPKSIKRYDIMNSEMQTAAFTKLEFTLPPKQTSDEGLSACSSVSVVVADKSHETKNKTEVRHRKFSYEGSNNFNNGKVDIHQKNNSAKSSRIKGLPELCVNYISKCGKSLSRVLQKKTPRRSFPNQLSFPSTKKVKTGLPSKMIPPLSLGQDNDKKAEAKSCSEANNLEDANNQLSEEFRCDKHENANQDWFRNLFGHFRLTANSRLKQAKSRNPDLT